MSGTHGAGPANYQVSFGQDLQDPPNLRNLQVKIQRHSEGWSILSKEQVMIFPPELVPM